MKILVFIILSGLTVTTMESQIQTSQINGALELDLNGLSNSIHIGQLVGDTIGAASDNVLIGYKAGGEPSDFYFNRPTVISNNTFVGSLAGYQYFGFNNTFLGNQAGRSSYGSNNTGLGYEASDGMNGSFNVTLGLGAGKSSSGSNNIYLGLGSGSEYTGDYNILIGSRPANDNIIPISNTLEIHSSDTATPYPLIYGEFDKRHFIIHHGSDDGLPSADQGLQLRRFNSDKQWTQHIQSDGDLAFYNSSGSVRMTLKENGNLFISGTLNPPSDINMKDNILAVDHESVLAKLKDIPISTWSYKGQEEIHMGPMAQDFYAAFGLGMGETTIATVDADGVALAAIQALAAENESLKKELDVLRDEIQKIKETIK